MTHDIEVRCDCGCHYGFHIHANILQDDGYAFITTTASPFFTKQCGIFETIKNRIKAALFMLIGKDYLLYDLMLNDEQWNAFVESVNKAGRIEKND